MMGSSPVGSEVFVIQKVSSNASQTKESLAILRHSTHKISFVEFVSFDKIVACQATIRQT
jgi:hypothetical protein